MSVEHNEKDETTVAIERVQRRIAGTVPGYRQTNSLASMTSVNLIAGRVKNKHESFGPSNERFDKSSTPEPVELLSYAGRVRVHGGAIKINTLVTAVRLLWISITFSTPRAGKKSKTNVVRALNAFVAVEQSCKTITRV